MNIEQEYPNSLNFSRGVWEWAVVNYRALEDYYKRWREYNEWDYKKLADKEESMLGCGIFYGSGNRSFIVGISRKALMSMQEDIIKHHIIPRKISANETLTYIMKSGLPSWEEWLDMFSRFCTMVELTKDEHNNFGKKDPETLYKLCKIEFYINKKCYVKKSVVNKFF